MKKRAFLIHGWDGYPEEGWRPWLAAELKKRDFEVSVPAMPNSRSPKVWEWVPYLSKLVGEPDENCFFVVHSLGCIAVLRYLEGLKPAQKVGGAVFVAGFGEEVDYEDYKGELHSFFELPPNWEKIKSHCQKFVAICSDDDPWVPPRHGRLLRDKLGAELIEMQGMKHFSGDDGITSLPIALESVLKIAPKDS